MSLLPSFERGCCFFLYFFFSFIIFMSQVPYEAGEDNAFFTTKTGFCFFEINLYIIISE
jgi:hypothetical protein